MTRPSRNRRNLQRFNAWNAHEPVVTRTVEEEQMLAVKKSTAPSRRRALREVVNRLDVQLLSDGDLYESLVVHGRAAIARRDYDTAKAVIDLCRRLDAAEPASARKEDQK